MDNKSVRFMVAKRFILQAWKNKQFEHVAYGHQSSLDISSCVEVKIDGIILCVNVS